VDSRLVATHVILAIALFVFTNWVGKHSTRVGYISLSVLLRTDEAPAFNFIYRAFAPVAFVTIASAMLFATGMSWATQDIYLVVLYSFLLRAVFNLLLGRALLVNWGAQIAHIIVSLTVAYLIYQRVISRREFFFPSAAELGTAVWVAVIVFLYHTVNHVEHPTDRTKARKERYVRRRYRQFKEDYGVIISELVTDRRQEMLVYAVMIYEDFNRPAIVRMLENLLFRVGKARSLGIMQVQTAAMISDAASVRLGAAKIVKDQTNAENALNKSGHPYGSWDVRAKTLESYNGGQDYRRQVSELHEQLLETFAPEARIDYASEFQRMAQEIGKREARGPVG